MRKITKTLLVAVILFILDLGLTLYHLNVNLDLVYEGNPLAAHPTLGWIAIILNIPYLLIVWWGTNYLRTYPNTVISQPNWRAFSKEIIKRDDQKYIFHISVFAFVYSTIASRIVVVTEWIIISILQRHYFTSIFYKIKTTIFFGVPHLIVMYIALILLIPLWFYWQWRKAKRIDISKD